MQHDSITPMSSDTSQNFTYLASHSVTASSLAKAIIITMLGFVLAWNPRLAACLGKVVKWVWPGLREA
jgi:hypothetical protein